MAKDRKRIRTQPVTPIHRKNNKKSRADKKKHEAPAPAAASPTAASLRIQDLKSRTTQGILHDFLVKKDVPNWYRGLSNYQRIACDVLFNALRDDAEQGSTHRVYGILKSMGLQPLISERAIKTLMRLSRCNDLAFLWFLMELYYKTPGNTYTINEQLIMSAIAHLDLISTIRELNRILPPKIKKPPPAKVKPKCLPIGPRDKYRNKYKSKLPYFQALPRPCQYGKSLLLKRPDFEVKLRFSQHINEKYVVQNESNRWFSDYNFQQDKRIVKRLLHTEIGNIFRTEVVTKQIKELIEDETNIAVKSIEECHGRMCLDKALARKAVLCEHHKMELQMERELANELAVKARDRCLRLIDVDRRRREACQKRVLDQLDKDISLYMCRYRRLRSVGKKLLPMHLLICRGCEQCELEDVENDSCEENTKCECEVDEPVSFTHIEERSSGLRREPSHPALPPLPKRFTCPKEPGVFFCRNTKDPGSSNSEQSGNHAGPNDQCKPGYSPMPRISMTCNPLCQVCSDETMVRFSETTSSSHPSEHFFHRPTDNLPYRFDFHKIFKFKNDSEGHEVPIDITKAFVEELDETARLEANRKNLPVRLHKACSNMVNRMWEKNVELKIEEMKAEEKKPETVVEETSYIYPIANYDPDDKALMDRMLIDALTHMQKDHKFVLASIPDTYKLPLLREWIYLRYGKKYSQKNRYQEFSRTIRIYHAMCRVNNINVPFPTVSKLGKNLNLDYSCRTYVHWKSEKMKRNYYRKVDEAIMEQARVFWFAMRPYLWSIGPPRDTYYAYMPARNDDILRFRLWKSNEYMDAKSVWDKRVSGNSLKHWQTIN